MAATAKLQPIRMTNTPIAPFDEEFSLF
jgi:hypothetical protein